MLIPINVAENGNTVPMTVSENGGSIEMGAEQVEIVEAISPTVDVDRVEGGVKITTHDLRGTQTEIVYDGAAGQPGDPGPAGADGKDGADGYSPSVSVTQITGGHRVSVTDATGTDVFDVMDGVDGQDGQTGPAGADGVGVPSGGTAGQVLVKASATDYDTAWADGGTGGGPYIQIGTAVASTAIKSGYGDIEVTFPVAFKADTEPHIMVCLSAGSITNTNAANVSLWVMSRTVTNEGFTARFFNSTVTNITPTISWIAIGEKA